MSEHEEHGHGEEHKGGHGGGGHGGHGGGHGGGGHEEHEGVPEWMISFADNTALMMGLFVILLALNMGPKGSGAADGAAASSAATAQEAAMADFAIELREAFNNPVDINSTDPREQPLVKRLREKSTGRTQDTGPAKTGPESNAIKPTEYSAIGGQIPFDDGSAVLSPTGKQRIADIAAKVGQLRYTIEVRGHTTPSETMRNETRSRQLSYERAMAVAQALAVQGVPWRQMRVVACGDSERMVARTYDRDEERQNQRAEVILTKDLVAEDPYAREVNRSNAASPTHEDPDSNAGHH
ncbi:MAG TPA: OmpA family protein [Phycisphaerales bacterium]|nr:OmpA family protein [Phycisphaerales bacterium]